MSHSTSRLFPCSIFLCARLLKNRGNSVSGRRVRAHRGIHCRTRISLKAPRTKQVALRRCRETSNSWLLTQTYELYLFFRLGSSLSSPPLECRRIPPQPFALLVPILEPSTGHMWRIFFEVLFSRVNFPVNPITMLFKLERQRNFMAAHSVAAKILGENRTRHENSLATA